MPELHWKGKDAAVVAARAVPYRPLIERPDLSHGDPAAGNLLIQGDNLDALKSLLPVHAGRVKCVFIDPPYNTRSAFEHYDDNYEHSTWLSLLYPRLELLRELLSEDGSIWVTIDDHEGHYLKVIMDEIFGRGNFVAHVLWQKKYAVANDHKSIAPMHDHVLVYRKSPDWRRNLLARTVEKDRQYRFEDAQGIFRTSDYTCNKSAEERPNLYYPIIHPLTGEEIWPKRTAVWRYSQDRHRENERNGLVYWGKDGTGKVPSYKRYRDQLKNKGLVIPGTWWTFEDAGHTDGARKEARAVLGSTSLADDFITPKPEKLIQRILEIATNPGDLVLDSFLGSGTTAAVAHKMGRRWIGVELGDHAVTHCAPRLRKVIDGEQGGISEAVGWTGGGGFRCCALGEPVFDGHGSIRPGVTFADLARWIWYRQTRQPLTRIPDSPLIGLHDGTAYYLLFNGILGDRRPEAGNVLTLPLLAELPAHDGPRVVFAEACLVHESRLTALNLTFRQLPYQAC